MSTIRRLYFYALSLISIEVVLWGVVNLIRTIVSHGLIGSGSLLATGLSLVLVGVPIFLLHWRTVQRDARRNLEERGSRIRAVFLYGALLSTLLPIVYALMAIIDRALIQAKGLPLYNAWLGEQGTALDNLIAILINAVVFAYFWSVLRDDWQANVPENFLADTRRLYRYLWVLFGLTLTVSGIYNLIRYLLNGSASRANTLESAFAGGIAMLLVGVPLWVYNWWQVQSALDEPEERRSLLRLVVLYLISLAGVIGVLSSAGSVVNSLLRWILGEEQTLSDFLRTNAGPLGVLIPVGVMWAYYGHILNEEVAAMADQPRRAALSRLYNYILASLGLAVTFAGLISLVSFLSDLIFTLNPVLGSFRSQISGAISALLIGLPLWLLTWRKMQFEAARLDEAGDHARRSVLRKAYLYLALFAFVLGAMGFTGQILYTLLNALFSGATHGIAQQVTRMLLSLAIDVLFLIYHWRSLRQDGRLAQQSLGALHAAFPTLVIVDESSPDSIAFAETFALLLKRVAPRLPVAIHDISRGAPDEALLGAKTVLLPVGLALDPPDSLRLWLADYQGRRILIPLVEGKWTWLPAGEKRPQDLAHEAAQAIRLLAEGEAVRQGLPNSPWAVAGYILGGIFGLFLLVLLFSLLASSLFR